MFLRDIDRLNDTRIRAYVSVLGAGALAGSSLPIDPQMVADELGFSNLFGNSLDAVSDRDFVADFVYSLSAVGVYLLFISIGCGWGVLWWWGGGGGGGSGRAGWSAASEVYKGQLG